MASTQDFIDYVCSQIYSAGDITAKKMFGEYMVYCNDRPIFLVCDNTVYVKMLPDVLGLFKEEDRDPNSGVPYKGAKPHYILDIEDGDFALDMACLLAKIIPLPKRKKPK